MGCGTNWLTSKHNTGSWRLKGLSLFSSSLIMAINMLLTIAVSKQCYYHYSKNLGKTFRNGIMTITARLLENLSEQYSARILEILSEWYYYYYSKNPQKPVRKYYYCDSKSPGKPLRMVLLLLRQKNCKNLSDWYYYYYSKNLRKLFRIMLLLLRQKISENFQNSIITVAARILQTFSKMVLLQQESWKTFLNSITTIVASGKPF